MRAVDLSEKPTQSNLEAPAEPEKIPGPAMRFFVKVQAGVNLLSAAATPMIVAKGIKKGGLNVPLPGGSKHFDLSSPNQKTAAVGIAAVSTVYGALNAVSRLRTVKDAETMAKVQQGTLAPEDAKMSSKRFDVVMTRMNAGLSGAIAVVSGAFAVRSLLDPTLIPDQKSDKVVGTLGAMAATGVMSVTKWRAANNAQRHIDEQNDKPAGHAERIEQERERIAQQDGPARG